MTRLEYEVYLMKKEFNAKKAHDYLVKCRKKDRINNSDSRNITIISGDFDSWIEKLILPYELTAEEIEEYISENWIYIYSAYDCTGKTFTRDIRCFPIGGKTIVYHFKGIDC